MLPFAELLPPLQVFVVQVHVVHVLHLVILHITRIERFPVEEAFVLRSSYSVMLVTS